MMSRNGPAGNALTTAAADTASPDSSWTVQPPGATLTARTGALNRMRPSSSAAIRSATVADPSATRRFSHSSYEYRPLVDVLAHLRSSASSDVRSKEPEDNPS